MRTIDENSITSATIEQMATTKDSRLKEIMENQRTIVMQMRLPAFLRWA